MTAVPPKTLCALLAQAGVATSENRVTLAAIGLAESGGELELVRGTTRGIWQISDSFGFDRQRMVSDAAYAAACAFKISGGGTNFQPWNSFRANRHLPFTNAARQGEAQSSAVVGTVVDASGSYNPGKPVVVAPLATGIVAPLAAAYDQPGPLTGLRITGTEMTADLASIVIGDPVYEAGFTTVPNLQFVIADPQGDLLWQRGNLWARGARVQYLDLDLRLDEITFEPGSHTTGQLSISAIDNIVYQLQLLRGARTARGISATDWCRQEMSLAGFNPALSFLGEALPSQTEIARDIPDQSGSAGSGEAPSAWTTIQRLAKETGKRVFVSGRKLIFGSAAFAMDWCAPGDLRIGWHASPEGERWLTLPSAKATSVGDRQGVTEVSGLVPLNRARYFRPGVSVLVHNTPSIAAGNRRFVCSGITHTLSRDVDGADVTLIEPIELKAEPKT